MKERTINLLKRIIPWFVAIGIIAILFNKYPIEQVWQSAKLANLWAFAALAIAYFFYQYFFDALSLTKLMNRFDYNVTFSEIAAGRGVTYLIMVLNYPASQGAFAYYLKRIRNVRVSEMLGIFFFMMVIDFLWIITMALVGSLFQDYTIAGISLKETVQFVAAIAFGGLFLHIAFWRNWFPLNFKAAQWWRQRKIFHIFNRARVSDYLYAALLRTPIHIAIVYTMYLLIHTFQADVSLMHVIAYTPIAFFIGTIPVTPGGLGTTNAAMVELLHPHVSSPLIADGTLSPQALLLGATLLWVVVNYALKAVTGALLLQKYSQKLFEPIDEEK